MMTNTGDGLSLPGHGVRAEDSPFDPRGGGSVDLRAPMPLATVANAALFLDFDGTLVEIVDHPDAVVVAPDLPDLLEALARKLDGRLAVVSGRSLAALDAMLGPVSIAMAGSHGGEFRLAGNRAVQPLADPLPPAIVADLAEFAQDHGRLLVEPKPFSVAVHYRHHPDARDALLAFADTLSQRHGLGLKHGKQVIELAMPGSDKGSAVSRFMQQPPFAGAVPLFLGDDVTDEDAFAAIGPLGGAGILVGPMRPTAASWRLADVAAVHDWLAAGSISIEGDAQA